MSKVHEGKAVGMKAKLTNVMVGRRQKWSDKSIISPKIFKKTAAHNSNCSQFLLLFML